MKVKYKRAFIKDIKRLPIEIRKHIETIAFDEIAKIDNISQIDGLKKIEGFSNFYRIKVKHYRMGIKLKDDTIIFIRVLHRKNIYRYFP